MTELIIKRCLAHSDGYRILKTLGFIEKERTEGHRAYLSLEWK